MASKITHLKSPADGSYNTRNVVKSKGEPRVVASGAAPAAQKSYKYVRSSGEPKVSHSGAAPSEQKSYPAKPNTKSR